MNFACASAAAVGLFFVLTAPPVVAAAVDAGDSRPAVWFAHDTIVDFENLPQPYTCDDLWYKLRDLLLALGARPDLKITFYQCGRSPSVHLQFSLPREVRGSEVKYASLQAIDDTFLIKAGRPSAFQASDCELVRQIKDTFLTELPVRVMSYRLTCDAPRMEARRYRLSVQALTPVSADRAVAASTGSQRAQSAQSGG
jgi:hypothetical protein